MVCLIYKIVNPVNNKVYIGQTWETLKQRLIKHKPVSSGCVKLRNAMIKYGKDNFKIELITIAHTQKIADYWEEYFIKIHDSIKNGYNILIGGASNSRKGIKHTEASKQKMSNSHKGKPSPNKGKPGAMKGRKHTKEARANMSKAKKNSPFTGDSRRGKHNSEEHKLKSSISNLGIHKGKTWKVIDGKRVWIKGT